MIKILKHLIGHESFVDNFAYIPVRNYNADDFQEPGTTNEKKCIHNEMYTVNWWFDKQKKVERDGKKSDNFRNDVRFRCNFIFELFWRPKIMTNVFDNKQFQYGNKKTTQKTKLGVIGFDPDFSKTKPGRKIGKLPFGNKNDF